MKIDHCNNESSQNHQTCPTETPVYFDRGRQESLGFGQYKSDVLFSGTRSSMRNVGWIWRLETMVRKAMKKFII